MTLSDIAVRLKAADPRWDKLEIRQALDWAHEILTDDPDYHLRTRVTNLAEEYEMVASTRACQPEIKLIAETFANRLYDLLKEDSLYELLKDDDDSW